METSETFLDLGLGRSLVDNSDTFRGRGFGMSLIDDVRLGWIAATGLSISFGGTGGPGGDRVGGRSKK